MLKLSMAFTLRSRADFLKSNNIHENKHACLHQICEKLSSGSLISYFSIFPGLTQDWLHLSE